ncbi:MAG: FAD-binding oxidoreductase [Promethearchaeota archaeon]
MDEKNPPNVFFDHDPSLVMPNIPEIKQKLTEIFGEDRVSTEFADKIAYGKDYWLISNMMNLEGKIPAYPDMIVWPENIEEISQLLKYANQHKPPLPIIPYGEGSGVVGGAIPIHGGITVDMKHFTSIEINGINMTAKIGAGVNGKTLERYLNKQGYRMGHIPQSLHTSTIGGYFAHRAAGQFSGKYGKFEDIVKSFELVLPSGEIIKSKFSPRASVGPMIDRMFLGSEGTLGIVTNVTCRIWPFPDKQAGLSFVFSTLQASLDAIRITLQGQINPAVIRIYDVLETKRHFGKTEKRSKNKLMVIFVCEGPTDLVDLELKITRQNCISHGGIECGDGPVDHWFETRFVVKESSEYAPYGLVFDTVEVAIPWDKTDELYTSVLKRIMEVPGAMMASGHASHFYPTGVCFYFTFTAVPKKEQTPLDIYNKCWDAAIHATLDMGGTAAHHHGMGLNRTRWMHLEHDSIYPLFQKIKRLLDPQNILNPGKLYSENVSKDGEDLAYYTHQKSKNSNPEGGN